MVFSMPLWVQPDSAHWRSQSISIFAVGSSAAAQRLSWAWAGLRHSPLIAKPAAKMVEWIVRSRYCMTFPRDRFLLNEHMLAASGRRACTTAARERPDVRFAPE